MDNCRGCRFQQVPLRARLTNPASGQMSDVDHREREKDLQTIHALEERENFDARQRHMLSYEPRFFTWCSAKTFPQDAELTQKRQARSQEVIWYKLCQIENPDGLCNLYTKHDSVAEPVKEPEELAEPKPTEPEKTAAPEFKIDLGTRLELVRSAVSPSNLPSRRVIGESTYWSQSGSVLNGSPQTEPIEIVYKLQPTQEQMALSGTAHSLCFGIFGAPGSGKTTLMMQMLQQILAYGNQPEHKKHRFGVLILDPKTSLVSEVRARVQEANRPPEDLIVLGTGEMNRGDAKQPKVNVLNCTLDPGELGKFLTRVAKSTGSGTSDNFWLQVLGEVLGATLVLLGASSVVRKPTLRTVLNTILDYNDNGLPCLEALMKMEKGRMSSKASSSWRMAISKVERFYSDSRTVSVVNSVLSSAFGAFQGDRFTCFSCEAAEDSLYESILRDGKIVVISQSGLDQTAAKVLCTLVKCLFQQTVLGRTEQEAKEGRPVALVCDEYSVIATELEGEGGDGHFFALAREKKCMGLLATQSVHTLETSSLGKAWRAVYGNFAARFFMRCTDPETAQEACKLAGASDWETVSQSFQTHGEAASFNESFQRQTRDHLLARQLMMLKTGEAFAVGMLDGAAEAVFTFMQVNLEKKK